MCERRRILTVSFALLFVCLAPELALAATYYVDKSGNDSNSCTTAQDTAPEYAKQSITSALGCPSPGDTIIVRQGTYDEFISSYVLTIPSGTEGYPITLMANPGDTVTIEGGSDPTAGEALVQLYDVHYFVVSGFIIDGLGLATRCVGIEWPSTGIRVEYNEIKGSALSAVLIDATGTELVGNYIHDGGYYDGGVWPKFGYGLYLTSYGNLIEGNEVYNMGRYGMHFYSQKGTLHDNIITGNRIHHNNQAAAGAGMILGGQNNLVYNNLIYDENNGHGIEVDYSNPIGNEIASNTIQNVAGYCLMIGADSSAQGTMVIDNTLNGCGYGPIYPSGTAY